MTVREPPDTDCQVLFQVPSVPPVAQHQVGLPLVVQVSVLEPLAMDAGLAVRLTVNPPPAHALATVADRGDDHDELPLLFIARTV